MKKYFPPLIAFGLFAITGCEEDDHDHEHGHVTISFLHPTDGEEVSLDHADHVEIHVKFEWEGGEGQTVEIVLHPEGDESDLIIDFSQHQHEGMFEFEQEVNLASYAAGTEFHLTAKGCEDHDCDEFEEADIHFKLVE